MKILIANNSGNVGKSFIAREVFYKNIKSDDKIIIEVESRNSSSQKFKNVNSVKVDGNDLENVFNLMYEHDEYIIDIGASQIIPFFTELDKSDGVDEDDIDMIIVPVTADDKIHDDSITTLKALKKMNLQDITKIVFNRVDNLKNIQDFINEAESLNYKINKELRILNYDAIKDINKTNMTSFQLANSTKDYKALAKEAAKNKDMEAKENYVKLYTAQKYAKGIVENVDRVYALLMATK